MLGHRTPSAREARLRSTPAILLLISSLVAACARGAAAPAPAPVAAPGALDPDAYARRRADSLRVALLARASWPTEEDACDPGALRVFLADTTAAEQARTAAIVEALEGTVASYGLDTRLDTPQAADLLRTLVEWEADGARPLWDVAPGAQATRRAIAPGLRGSFRNVRSGKCESCVRPDSVTFLPPSRARIAAPRVKGVRIGLVQGDSTLRRSRSAFFARDTAARAVYAYARGAPVVVWGDYALATVRRLSELRGGIVTAEGDAGNASYVFHRAGGEWRLLAIARSW